VKTGQRLADLASGTINIRFEPMIIVARTDYRTKSIRWNGGDRGEVFDLVRVRLKFEELCAELPALMYVAHGSMHRIDPRNHEFLAKHFVEGLRQDMRVLMSCDREFVELPYGAWVGGENGRPRLARTIVIL
jgi:hypothetical protein